MSAFDNGPKAIETHYKGYRFRSRLEARWAVFFGSLGIVWDYEKQGYDIAGTWYLPDFWLPYESKQEDGWGHWIEIKALPLSEKEARLIAGLVKATGHRAYALCGQPWPDEHTVYVFQHHHMGVPDRIPLISSGRLVEINHHKGTEFEQIGFIECRITSDEGEFPFHFCKSFGELQRAFRAAREARFEHGENPQ